MPDDMTDAGAIFELQGKCVACQAESLIFIGTPRFEDGRIMEPKAFAEMLTGQVMLYECQECAAEGIHVEAVRCGRLVDVPEAAISLDIETDHPDVAGRRLN